MLVRNLPRAVTTTNEMNVILTSVYSKCTFRFNEKKKKIKAILLGWKENHVVFEGEKKNHMILCYYMTYLTEIPLLLILITIIQFIW